MKAIRALCFVTILVTTGSCIETFAAESVALNVARLTVLNADAAITALSDDTNCGFASDQVRNNRVITGEPLSEGTLQLLVEDCEINFEEPTIVSTDCDTGVTTTAYGRIVFNRATLTVSGTLLPSEDNPIIPSGEDSVVIEADVSFDNFMAGDSDQDAHMVWIDGGLSGVVMPRMAEGADGFCSVQTGNKAFWDVNYEPSHVQIVSGDVTMNIDVGSSNLFGAQGVHHLLGEEAYMENELNGEIGVWGETYSLPLADDPGLDPEYDADEFILSDECREDIVVPINFDCGY